MRALAIVLSALPAIVSCPTPASAALTVSGATAAIVEPIPVTCPATIKFTGTITATATAVANGGYNPPVEYQWINEESSRSRVRVPPAGSLTFKVGGPTTQTVSGERTGILHDGWVVLRASVSTGQYTEKFTSSTETKFTFVCTNGATAAEHCVAYKPDGLRADQGFAGGPFFVTDGTSMLANFRSLDEALLAVSVLKKGTQRCGIDVQLSKGPNQSAPLGLEYVK